MTSLTLTLIHPDSVRIDLAGITPDRVGKLEVSALQKLRIPVGGRATELGEVFRVVDGGRDLLQFNGDLSYCDRVGGGMRSGRLRVVGNCGDQLAAEMLGGHLHVIGNAGSHAGGSLLGGEVRIEGNVGNYAAAALPGGTRGMSGGSLVVLGHCGDWLSYRMRRGTVVVRGLVGQVCATAMIAGTIVVGDRIELPFGCEMQRGSLVVLNPTDRIRKDTPPGFTGLQECELSFLPLLLRAVARHLPDWNFDSWASAKYLRSIGDRAADGQGELILPQ